MNKKERLHELLYMKNEMAKQKEILMNLRNELSEELGKAHWLLSRCQADKEIEIELLTRDEKKDFVVVDIELTFENGKEMYMTEHIDGNFGFTEFLDDATRYCEYVASYHEKTASLSGKKYTSVCLSARDWWEKEGKDKYYKEQMAKNK